MSIYTIKNDKLVVCATELGAELCSIKTKDGTEYLWQGDSNYWSGKAPNLFPYVARLVDGKYIWKGNEYNLQIHGFARQTAFNVARATENSITFELTESEASLAVYPAKFVFSVTYTLEGSALKVEFAVRNKDDKEIIFGLGAHPGFNVPLEAGKKFEDYKLTFEKGLAPKRVIFDEKCFVLPERQEYKFDEADCIKLHHDMFDDDAIVLEDAGHTVSLESGSGKSVTVKFPSMKYIGFWHAVKTNAPYICIEPWCSLPAKAGAIVDFEKQNDLIHLQINEEYKNEWEIIIK